MAVGRDALLSHGAAAVLWGLVGEPPEPFDVTTIRRNRHGPAGIVLHRPRHPPDAARRRGVPVTTVPQTLLDVASTVIERTLERAIREAHARWLVRRLTLLAFVDQAAGLPGAPALREALGRSGATRSAAERAFLRLCRRERLELPLVNVSVAGEDVDFFWPQHDLVVETDGYATYATRDGFEHDRRLDATLARAGTRVQRFTWRQLDARPREVAETLSALGVLKAGRPPAGAGPMLDVDATLRTLISVEGSDLQLKVNAPPLARIHGRLGPREGDYNVLGQQDTEAAVHHMLKDPNKLEEFKREGEVDFAYAVAGLARFRVNAFRQRGSISLACRAIPFSVRSIERCPSSAPCAACCVRTPT